MGKHVDAQHLPSDNLFQHIANGTGGEAELQEEVFEIDGQVEDVIAVDYNPGWEVKHH